jgi:UDP-N-acetylmuramoyl-tripeptide--D-alanyl-D-alanine ligase
LVILIYRPKIIAIAGSTNKTFVKDAIKKNLLAKQIKVSANPKSYNTEIGLPLAILNLPSGYNSFKAWLPIIQKSLLSIFKKDFPKYLILEYGVASKGDMRFLTSIAKPNITIITDLTQRYLESFPSMDHLSKEYQTLIKNTQPNGLLILNFDNKRVRYLEKSARKDLKIKSFAIKKPADYQAIEVHRGKSGEIIKIKIKGEQKIKTIKLNRFGRHNIYVKLIEMIVENIIQKNRLKRRF